MSEKREQAQQALEAGKKGVNQRYRPAYHLCVPAGWLNDPNGFGRFKGKYHLFYQFHPYGTEWGPMHWGHWESEDLVSWRELPVALAPDEAYDAAGCFSGTAVEWDDKLTLMYTGVRKTGLPGACHQQQCIAQSVNGIDFEKWADNPVISVEDLPQGAHPADFRDPKVMRTENGFRAIIASKGKEGGQLLAYTSPDLRTWTYDGIYLRGIGKMAECPDCFSLGGKEVLLACVMGTNDPALPSRQPVVYWVGENGVDGSFVPATPMLAVDRGHDFYAPQTALTADGRRVMIGWVYTWGHVMPTHYLGHGWQGMMTLPRECTLREGRLLQMPLRELETLRGQEREVEPCVIGNRTELFPLRGKQMEIALAMQVAKDAVLRLYVMETGEEKLCIGYDEATETLWIDRSACAYSLAGPTRREENARATAKVPLCDRELRLRIFVDHCMVEVFAQQGKAVMTSMAFPKGEAYGVSMQADGMIRLVEGKGWPMGPIMR